MFSRTRLHAVNCIRHGMSYLQPICCGNFIILRRCVHLVIRTTLSRSRQRIKSLVGHTFDNASVVRRRVQLAARIESRFKRRKSRTGTKNCFGGILMSLSFARRVRPIAATSRIVDLSILIAGSLRPASSAAIRVDRWGCERLNMPSLD